jgi:hypothetical protein
MWQVGIPSTGLTPPHCCSCHKLGPGFTLLFLSQARTWIHIVVPVTSQDLDSHCCSCHNPGPGFTLLFLSQSRTWIHIVVPVTSQDLDSTTLNMRLWLSFIFLVYYFVFNVYLPLFIYRVYQGTCPTLIIADPDLIRDLFIKEFGNFTNRPVSFIM